jgi:holo-[acyl-carrier protein] synthase
MVLGVGFDLEDLEDFGRTMDQSGEAFLNRVYTEPEIEYCRSQPHALQSYAARYCAKEAAMKALGIAGMEGLKWRDFEILRFSVALTFSGRRSGCCRRSRLYSQAAASFAEHCQDEFRRTPAG